MKFICSEFLPLIAFASAYLSELQTESTRKTTCRLSESRNKVKPPVVPLGNVIRETMPSVGMRRTTRVFGVVKGGDGARVLRSGRRLWPDSVDVKIRKPNNVDDWLKLVKTNKGYGGDLGYKTNDWDHLTSPKQDDVLPEFLVPKLVEAVDSNNGRCTDKLFGAVYCRKRRRPITKSSDFDVNLENSNEDRMFGLQFVRRQKRRGGCHCSLETQNVDSRGSFLSEKMVSVAMQSSYSRTFLGARFLYSVLMYMTRTRLRLAELSAFLLSEPINNVYSSSGIHVFWAGYAKSSGSCHIFEATQFIPMFSVDFSAIPFWYKYMHCCMFLRYKFQPLAIIDNYIDVYMRDVNLSEGGHLSFPLDNFILDKDPESEHSENQQVLHPSVRASKLAGGSSQYKNGLSSRSTQKRRSSLRRRKARNTYLIGGLRPNGPFISDLMSFQKREIPFSSLPSNNKIRNSNAGDLIEESPTMVGLPHEVDLSHCSADLLVIESDKCYREKGVDVLLEFSPSGEWLLVVKKNGQTRFIHKAEKIIRPPSSNRFTHATVWSVDNSWKLEFHGKQDWTIFRDLYKECSERNTPVSSVKVIPVPGVSNVPDYGDGCNTPFIRPNFYISLNGDEVSRAMAKRTAIYDMDSDDEEWLKKLNSNVFSKNQLHEHISEDTFELMIDVFEKAFHCNPNEITDEKGAVNICQDLYRKEVVEAVYGYWMKKRKQRKASLLRVFQGHVKKAPVITKPHLRKKRSFKRQPSRLGKGKHLNLLRAMAAEQDAREEQKAKLRLEEAKASANRLTEVAIHKRQRAQLLMENADLATYKATVAVRIAEASRIAESTDAAAAAAYFLD